MTHTFIIAEAGSSHDNDIQKAYRLIEAAKECGADAVKFQWTSDAVAMMNRRGLQGTGAGLMYGKYLLKSPSWLESLKAHADKIGIEFMCTVYLIEDIATIAPLVKRFKVSAFEAKWHEFIIQHPYPAEVIVSVNPNQTTSPLPNVKRLHCVSKYPTAIEELGLHGVEWDWLAGLSDHTTSVITGALAIAIGATIVEKHIKLYETSNINPDFPHSLEADAPYFNKAAQSPFGRYVRNIREAEKAL